MSNNSYDFKENFGSIIGVGIGGNGNYIARTINIEGISEGFIKRLLAVQSDSILVSDKEAKKIEKDFLELEKEVDNIIERIKIIEKENNISAKCLKDDQNNEIPISEIQTKRKIIKIFDFFNRNRKNESNFYYERGYALNSIGKFEEALLYLEKGIGKGNNNPDIWISMSYSYRGLRKYHLAIECCDKALELEINNSKAWSKKGRLFYELDKIYQAIECFDKSLKSNLSDWESWKDKGKCLLKINKFEQAIECFDKSLKKRPDNDRAWYYKGMAYINLNKYKQAIECFDKCIIINPKDSDSLYERGRSKILDKNQNEGIADLKNAININKVKYMSRIYHDKTLFNIINNPQFKNLI